MAPPLNDLGHPPDVTVLTVSRETVVQNAHMVTMEMIVVMILFSITICILKVPRNVRLVSKVTNVVNALRTTSEMIVW